MDNKSFEKAKKGTGNSVKMRTVLFKEKTKVKLHSSRVVTGVSSVLLSHKTWRPFKEALFFFP